MKKKILIVCASQFGYLIDTFEYCKKLKDDYDVTYVCIDQGLPILEVEGVSVHYHKSAGRKGVKWIGFVIFACGFVQPQDIIIIKYFRLCSLIKMYVKDSVKVVLDIRTGAISPSFITRFIFDNTLKLESVFFKDITVVSKSLADQLNLKRAIVIPLGAPKLEVDNKSFSNMNLLYVGTLSNRRIIDTVLGLKEFILQKNSDLIVTYDIVGDGYGNEVQELKSLVVELKLEGVVNVHGRIPYDQLLPFFQRSNVGVAYIPLVSYYDVQPVTKTLEYISCGMAVIGTDTLEQRNVIKNSNGILCKDNYRSFSNGLIELNSKFDMYESEGIKGSVSIPSWNDVVEKLKSNIINIEGKKNA
jgi:glycosyltransferase involved in cell wall biosynthesis